MSSREFNEKIARAIISSHWRGWKLQFVFPVNSWFKSVPDEFLPELLDGCDGIYIDREAIIEEIAKRQAQALRDKHGSGKSTSTQRGTL